MDREQPDLIRLEDYRPPAYRTVSVDLHFDLDPDETIVTARQHIVRSGHADSDTPLVLHGDGPAIISIDLDGQRLDATDYRLTEEELRLRPGLQAFDLTVTTKIAPAANTALQGLYISRGVFCTQCEPEGFRCITYFQDRPDVMARYRVRIEGDAATCPVMLSNGNLVEQGTLADGRHFAQWEDPFPKPSYLFALVAGDLASLEDHFTTRSGREVALRIYSEHRNISQCHHAMDALKRSMRWDEEVYGLEYDLDLYQIVAVEDFNTGAMENKGLNVFNTSATLAHAETATDTDFMQVERIIAHEYFHNWTGNRVTCRDWFQLTLKEGLTVFRDQQFGADVHSEAVSRIGAVTQLREAQFPEDAGPLAHPIRPDSYIEINNFYTRTVYSKGAEAIRMIHTVLGPGAFRKGMDLYFARHDGEAVTCEDFVSAMADASGVNLDRYMAWYHQAGTPEVIANWHHDKERGTFRLELSQYTPPSAGQGSKVPLPMPLRLGLIGKDSRQPLSLRLAGENVDGPEERVLQFDGATQIFEFEDIIEEPVPSLFRGFSAPIKMQADLSAGDLSFLLVNDVDPFNKWEAGQRLYLSCLRRMYDTSGDSESSAIETVVRAISDLLDASDGDPTLTARAASLPSRLYFAEQLDVIDVDMVDRVCTSLRRAIGNRLGDQWQDLYGTMSGDEPFSISRQAIGRRSLKAVALHYLVWGEHPDGLPFAHRQFENADNMTDRLSALNAIADHDADRRDAVLDGFYDRWRDSPLVIDKWFAVQAMIEDESSVERICELLSHPGFNLTTPNRVRALIGTFAAANMTGFHRRDGSGYELLSEIVETIDKRNPQLAARLVIPLGNWRRFEASRQALMKAQLEKLAHLQKLSRDSYEIVTKSLGG